MLARPDRLPRATYRLQFTPDFRFIQAKELVPYLSRLGISDIYASPILQASSTSTHGYDVNDYNRISATLGGSDGLDRLSTDLRREGMGLLIDFVPNHMGIDGEHNVWWRHVLENGMHSKFASFFDIEWHPRLERLQDRVLVPMLDDHYGAVLESGRLRLEYGDRRFFIHYGAMKLPIRPSSYSIILEQIIDLLPSGDARKSRLRELADAFESLPPHDPEDRDAQLEKLQGDWEEMLVADRPLENLLRVALVKINGIPADPSSFIKLHDLLELQYYRLAHWKVGAHEVNYRRFFAVDTLVGLRMENEEVFAAAHLLLGDLLASHTVTGIRLDHIDGLWNPAQYLLRLEALVREKTGGTAYTLVEKILAPEEHTPESWPIHGTTGYEFAASLINLFLDRKDEPEWTQIYDDFTGEKRSSRDLTYEDKLFALQEIFPNAVATLASELDALVEPDWHWRDVSLHDIETALRHFLACLPVYRTYRMPGEEMPSGEKKWLVMALNEAIERNPCIDPVPIRFLFRVLIGEYPGPEASAEQRAQFDKWVCKLQQATGAVMAKSVEDTHFYRYVRMVGANEVGNHPSRFGEPVAAFHEANLWRLKHEPFCQLATSTHDTKWSEDARARLVALAELPDEWRARLSAWHKMNQPARQEIEGRQAPDSREEYLFYQALLAAWPLNLTTPDEVFRNRMKDYFRKAQAEAKLNTSWTYPHVDWQSAGEKFIDAILASPKFLADFVPFARRIAERGMIFSLAQTVLKLTSPGVPDFYQGTEIWDFSLVDPDNRRSVDFEARVALLDKLDERSPEELFEQREDGGLKMAVTKKLLQARREFPELFAEGDYKIVQPEGEHAEYVIAFLRKYNGTEVLIVTPRRLGPKDQPFIGLAWNGIRLPLDETRQWKNLLTGEPISATGGKVGIETLFRTWPVAVLISR